MKFLHFLICLWCFVAVDGLNRFKRMAGGNFTINHHPWQVALLEAPLDENDTVIERMYCGGVLIHNWFVMTAAHCVTEAWNWTASLNTPSLVNDIGYGYVINCWLLYIKL